MGDPNNIEVRHGLMEKQHQFVTDEHSWEILYSGAFGAGKTRALCVRAFRLAHFPGARVGLCRKTTVDLKATTLVTLLEPDGELPPVIPEGTYRWHKTDSTIRINGGGIITYFGVDDPQRIGSRLITDICIDEGIELDLEEYIMLVGRKRGRYRKPNGTMNQPSLAVVTNPGSPTHFLYERFYEDQHPHRRVIETNTAENKHLPKDYVQSLNELTGAARERFFLGKWVSYEGAVYPMFLPRIHVVKNDERWPAYCAGVDWGFRNPCVIRLHGYDLSGRSHVVYEFYRSGVISSEFADHCKRVADDYAQRGLVTFVVDPSASDLIEQMRRRSLYVEPPADKSVAAGIRMVQSALAPENGPKFTMSPECEKGNREYGAYRWRNSTIKEEPIKELDHALDADRYARTFIEMRAGSVQMDRNVMRRRKTSRRASLRA